MKQALSQCTWKQWLDRGTARLRTRNWAHAAEALTHAVEHDDADAQCFYRLGIAHQKLQQWPEAAAALEQAVQRDDDASHGWYRLDWRHRLAFALRMCGDAAAAGGVYRSGSHLDAALEPWWQRFETIRDDAADADVLCSLWSLLDDDGRLQDENAARNLIAQARSKWHLQPDKWWFAAYVELYRRGFVTAAYEAKAVAAAVLRAAVSPPPDTTPAADQPVARDLANGTPRAATAAYRIDHAAAAFADVGDLASARQHAQHLGRDDLENQAAYAALAGDFQTARTLWQASDAQQSRHEAETHFGNLVRGRSIAVVAPAASEQLQGEDIDSHDLVIRTNFRSHDVIQQHASCIGRRTDISYYNGNFEPEHRDEILAELKRAPLRFVVLRFDDPVMDHYRNVVPVRASRLVNPLYRMNAYAIPKIVYDLLRFGPKSIKVYNADFFLGPKAHYHGYLDYRVDLVRSFLGHDIVRNFLLMKRWMELDLVQADARLTRILQMSEAEVISNVAQKVQELVAARAAQRRHA